MPKQSDKQLKKQKNSGKASSIEQLSTPESKDKKSKVISPIDMQSDSSDSDFKTVLKEIRDMKSDLLTIMEANKEENSNNIRRLEVSLNEIKDSVNYQQTENEELKMENVELKQKVLFMEGRLTRTENVVHKLETQYLDIQSRQMENNILFFNIDEAGPGENVETVIRRFMKDEMRILESDSIVIEKCHRIGRQHGNRTRPIVIKLSSNKAKGLILKSGRNLAGKKYAVRQQQPREFDEKAKHLLPLYKQARSEGKETHWSKGKLIIGSKVLDTSTPPIRDVNLDITARARSFTVTRGPLQTHNGCTLQASCVKIQSTNDITPAFHAVISDDCVARGTHNVYAFRDTVGRDACDIFEDDGDYGSGRYVLSLMKEKKVSGLFICITRWGNSPLLGISRLDAIRKAVDSVIN